MLRIYGNRRSGNSNKVEYTAILLGLEYDFKEMDFQKDLKTEQYLKVHPAGKIPAIDDNGFILFESGAICKYLCDKNGSTLFPKDLKKRAIVEQWGDFSVQHVGTAMSKVAFNMVFAPMRGLPTDENSLKEGLQNLERFLPIVERQLSKSKYLAGDTMTIADLTLFSVFEYADAAKFDLSDYKGITKWRKHIMEMDFYKKFHEKSNVLNIPVI